MSALFQRVRVEYRPIGTSLVTETFEPPPEVVGYHLQSARVVYQGPWEERFVELIWIETVGPKRDPR